MIGVHDQHEVRGLRKIGRFGTRLHGHKHAQMFVVRTLGKVTQHVRFNVNSEQLPFGYALSDPHAELSVAGAEVGDTCGSLKMQHVQNLIRLLPSVTGRVIELFGPHLSVTKRVLIASI